MESYHIFVALNIYIRECLWIKYIYISLSIIYKCDFQLFTKYCKAIMDDLLLFTPMKISHIAKLEDLLKYIALKWIKDIT